MGGVDKGIVVHGPFTALDPRNFVPDADHRIAEVIDFPSGLAFGWFDHQRARDGK